MMDSLNYSVQTDSEKSDNSRNSGEFIFYFNKIFEIVLSIVLRFIDLDGIIARDDIISILFVSNIYVREFVKTKCHSLLHCLSSFT